MANRAVLHDSLTEVFFALLRAGLWEQDVRLSEYGEIDYEEVMRLAEEQSVVGLITAGLEHVTDLKVLKEVLLQFIGQSLQIEQRNKEMDAFIEQLIERIRKADIYALLLKGQGVAQCYERPHWRANGDVDLFLSEENYAKANALLQQIGVLSEQEEKSSKHVAYIVDSWLVELHGTLRCGLSFRMDKGLEEIRRSTFYGGEVRSWLNNKTSVFLLQEKNDAVYIFAHFLKYFYKSGLGLRQICDWCRLLWFYRESLNHGHIESRIRKMGLMSEWKAFAAFAVEYLGMPTEAMPLYDGATKWKRRACKICAFILHDGNMGHNYDTSYYSKYPYLVRKFISFSRRVKNLFKNASVFPLDSFCFSFTIMFNGMRSVVRGE